MAKAYEYKALGFSGEDVDSISVAIDDSNNLTVKATLKDGTVKSSDPVALPAGGTEVEANPTLEGTESDLTGLAVNGTKYKVPTGGTGGGTQLYDHNLLFVTGDCYVQFSIINTDSSIYNGASFFNYLRNRTVMSIIGGTFSDGTRVYYAYVLQTYEIDGVVQYFQVTYLDADGNEATYDFNEDDYNDGFTTPL